MWYGDGTGIFPGHELEFGLVKIFTASGAEVYNGPWKEMVRNPQAVDKTTLGDIAENLLGGLESGTGLFSTRDRQNVIVVKGVFWSGIRYEYQLVAPPYDLS